MHKVKKVWYTFVPRLLYQGFFFCLPWRLRVRPQLRVLVFDSTNKNKKCGGWIVFKALVGEMATQHKDFYGENGSCWPADDCGTVPVQVPGSQARKSEGFLKNQESRQGPGDLHSTSLSKQGAMATLMQSRCACMCDCDKAMSRAGTAAASCERC